MHVRLGSSDFPQGLDELKYSSNYTNSAKKDVKGFNNDEERNSTQSVNMRACDFNDGLSSCLGNFANSPLKELFSYIVFKYLQRASITNSDPI